MNKKTGLAGITLIKSFESLHDGDLSKIGLQPKMDPVGIWTEGWGHAIVDENGEFVRGKDKMQLAYKLAKIKTEEEADQILFEDLGPREKTVNKMVKVKLNQNQFDALVSFVYNIGSGNFQKSSVLKWLNLGELKTAADSFKLFNKAGGEVMLGLIRRRLAEKELFLKAVKDQTPIFEWIDKYVKPHPMEKIIL